MKDENGHDMLVRAVREQMESSQAEAKEIRKQIREGEKHLAEIQASVSGLTGKRDALERDYLAQEAQIAEAEERNIRAGQRTQEDLRAGHISLAQYQAQYRNNKEIAAEAKAKAQAATVRVREALIGMNQDLLELQLQAAEEEQNLAYLEQRPSLRFIEASKGIFETHQEALNRLTLAMWGARQRKEELRRNLNIGLAHSLEGRVWDGLTLQELRRLPYSGEVPNWAMQQLNAAILTAEKEPDQTWRLSCNVYQRDLSINPAGSKGVISTNSPTSDPLPLPIQTHNFPPESDRSPIEPLPAVAQ